MLTSKLYYDIDGIDKCDWDEIAGEDFFMSYDYLLHLSKSLAQEYSCRFITVYDINNLVAIAAIHTINLDLENLAATQFMKKTIRAARKINKNAFILKSLVIGSPPSIGNKTIIIKECGYDKIVIMKEFIRKVKEIAQSDKSAFILFKEFNASSVDEYRDIFRECGFLVAPSFPGNVLSIDKWDSYDSYLNAMRNNYRYPIKKRMKKLDAPEISVVYNENFSEVLTDEHFALYMNVLEKADAVYEVLNKQYFQGISLVSKIKPCLISIYMNKKLIGYSLVVDSSSAELSSLFVGIDYDHFHEYDTYFNLFYETIKLAFLRKKAKVSLGQKSDDFKSRLGSVPKGLYLVFMHRNPLINGVLKMFDKYIIPNAEFEVKNVFKDDD